MRALRVLEVFEPVDGGIPEHVRLLAPRLASRGFDVVVAGRAEAAPRVEIEAAGIPYVPLPIVGEMLALDHDVPTARAIARLLRGGNFDLVHAHGQKPGLLARTVAVPFRVPVIFTPHALVHRHQLDVPSPGARGRYLKTLWMERALRPLTAGLIAVSDDERRVARRDGLISERRSRTILNGVAAPARRPPDPRLMGVGGGGPLFGMVSGLRDQKGLPTLLAALERLAAAGTPVRFAIVGNGPLEQEVRARVAGGLLAATTAVVPYNGDVGPYLAALDAYVLPSYWEGLPLGVLEAMHAGLPVVASAVGGTPEAILDEETGLLVEARDVDGLARAVARLAGDAALRERLGAAARALAVERFAADRMVGEIAAFYREVVARGARRGGPNKRVR